MAEATSGLESRDWLAAVEWLSRVVHDARQASLLARGAFDLVDSGDLAAARAQVDEACRLESAYHDAHDRRRLAWEPMRDVLRRMCEVAHDELRTESNSVLTDGASRASTGVDLMTCVELKWRSSPYLSLRSLTCDWHAGVFTLRGKVPTEYLRTLAESLANKLLADAPTLTDAASASGKNCVRAENLIEVMRPGSCRAENNTLHEPTSVAVTDRLLPTR